MPAAPQVFRKRRSIFILAYSFAFVNGICEIIAILRQNIYLPLFPALPPGSKKDRTPAGTALK